MKTQPRLLWSAIWPACFLVVVLALIALACSNSKPDNIQTPNTSATQSQKLEDNPRTPLATHVVFSPLIGSGGTPAAPAVYPGVNIQVSSTTLKVGEEVTVTVLPGDVEQPICYLFVRDSGVGDVAHTVGVSAENETYPGTATSQVLGLISAIGENGQAVFILRGLGEGTTEVWASVIPGGPATGGVVSGGVTQSISVTVQK